MSLKPGYFKQFCSCSCPSFWDSTDPLYSLLLRSSFHLDVLFVPGCHREDLNNLLYFSQPELKVHMSPTCIDVCGYPDVHHGWSAGATRDLGAPLLRLWLLTWNGWSRPPFWQENEVNCTWRLWTFTKRCCLRMTRDVLNFIPDSTHRCM